MSKDDYRVIKYKVLLYLYACLKRRIIFDQATYDKAIGKEAVDESYLANIYRMMQEEGLIDGAAVTRAWGSVAVMVSEESDIRITARGIGYLEENGTMKKVGRYLTDRLDIVADLIRVVGLT